MNSTIWRRSCNRATIPVQGQCVAEALIAANSSVPAEDRGYTYDTAWNLNYRTNNGSLSTFIVDTRNQLTNSFAARNSYDSNGNLVSSHNNSSWAYDYDDENRLVQLLRNTLAGNYDKASQFLYDGFGRLRVRQEYHYVAGGGGGDSAASLGGEGADSVLPGTGTWVLDSETHYIYDGWRVIQERDGSNTPTVSYTRGNDLSVSLEGAGGVGGLLARSDGYSSGDGSWSSNEYYYADGNGNITSLTDGSQNIVASYRYDPFGNIISKSGTLADANVYRFSSKEVHVNSGMYYYGFRFYDPNLQRWINRDPIEEEGGVNLYGFVSNASINRRDLKGESDCNRPPISWSPTAPVQYGPPALDPSMQHGPTFRPKDFAVSFAIGASVYGGALAVDALAPQVLAWLGFGGTAASTPQGQKALQAAVQEGNAILEDFAKLEDALFQARMKQIVADAQYFQLPVNSPARKAAEQQAAAAANEVQKALNDLFSANQQCGH